MAEQNKALCKLLSDHTKLAEQEAKTRAARVQISRAQFLEYAAIGEGNEESTRLQLEIDDIKKDMATHDRFTDSLIVSLEETRTKIKEKL